MHQKLGRLTEDINTNNDMLNSISKENEQLKLSLEITQEKNDYRFQK